MDSMGTPLKRDIAAFEEAQNDLEAAAMGKWVLVHDAVVIDTFDTFEAAAERAVGDFGAGPYLIRQVGSSSVSLPASVMYQIV